MGNLETLIEGSRVRFDSVTHDDEKGGKETSLRFLPDASCANFYLESTSETDSAIIQFIARSFRPRVGPSCVPFSLRFFDPTGATE
jgi:hypothetical protein